MATKNQKSLINMDNIMAAAEKPPVSTSQPKPEGQKSLISMDRVMAAAQKPQTTQPTSALPVAAEPVMDASGSWVDSNSQTLGVAPADPNFVSQVKPVSELAKLKQQNAGQPKLDGTQTPEWLQPLEDAWNDTRLAGFLESTRAKGEARLKSLPYAVENLLAQIDAAGAQKVEAYNQQIANGTAKDALINRPTLLDYVGNWSHQKAQEEAAPPGAKEYQAMQDKWRQNENARLQQVQEAGMKQATKGMPEWGKTATQLASGILDSASQAALGSMTGVDPNIIYAAGALAESTAEAEAAGASKKDQAAYGVLQSALTYATGKLFAAVPETGDGVVGALAKKSPKLANVITNVTNRIAKNPYGKQILDNVFDSLGEGLEEVIQEAATPYMQRLTYDPDADAATVEDLTTAFLLGTLSSMAYNAPSTVSNAINAFATRDKSAKSGKTADAALVDEAKKAAGVDNVTTDVDNITNNATPEVKNVTTKVDNVNENVDNINDSVDANEVVAEIEAHKEKLTPKAKALPEAVQHTKDWETAAYQAREAGKKLGVPVEFVSWLPDGVDGMYRDGKIYISNKATDPLKSTFVHELTHHLEATNTYTELSKYVLDRAAAGLASNGDSIDSYRAYIKDSYAAKGKVIDDASVDAEIVAKYIEKNLFNNSKEIAKLAKTHRNLVQVIRDWFADMRVKLRGTAEEKELLRAQRLFEQALRETDAKGYRTSGDGQYSFAGEKAETADLEALERAKQMQTAGVDASTILRDTGWFVGRDGKWRFEIDDSGMQYFRGGDAAFRRDHPEYAEYQSLMAKMLDGSISAAEYARMMELHGTWGGEYKRLSELIAKGNARLPNIIDHPVLFAAYPDLKYVRVGFDALDNGEMAKYNPLSLKLTINEKLKNAPEKTLLHEIQHAIQQIEDFTKGSSPQYWADYLGAEATDKNGRTPFDLYRNTSGEIEARDAANRMKLTAEDRRAQMPDLGDENTVFAEGAGNAYSYIGKTKDGVPVYKSDFEDTVSKAKRKQLFENRIATIFNLGAVKLNTDTKKIEVLGDRFTFDKNLYGDDYATDKEYSAKINALYDMADILSNSTFVGKNAEDSYVNNVPPKNKAHKNVKYWYKFKNEIVLDGSRYDVVFNIRDKGKDQYAYLIEFREKETPANSNTATKNSLLRTKQVSLDSKIPQTKSSVKTSGQNSIPLGKDDLLRSSSGRSAADVKADTKALVDEYSAMDPHKQEGVREATYPYKTPAGKVMRTPQNIGGSNLVDDRIELDIEEAIANGKFAYEVKGDKKSLEHANKRIEGGRYESLAEQAKGLFADGYRLKKEQVVFVERMIQEAAKRGDAKTAMALITDLAAYGTEQGQNIQALSMIRRMTPEGKLMVLNRQVEKANEMTKVDKESKRKVKEAEREIKTVKEEALSGLEDLGIDKDTDLADAVELVDEAIAAEKTASKESGLPTAKETELKTKRKKLTDAEKKVRELEKAAADFGKIKLSEKTTLELLNAKSMEEQNDIYNRALDEIASQIVSSIPDRLNAWRYLAMLGNPRTHIRNVTGNATMYATNAAKNVVKYALERIPGTKKTTALKTSKDAKEFAKEDFELNRDLITGGGKHNASDELRDRMTVFRNKGLEWARRKNFDAMEAEDNFFIRHAYESALARYITANKKNKAFLESGSKAAERFIEQAREYAIKEAHEVTFHDDSALADWLSGITKSSKNDKFSTKAAKTLVEGVLPFKKTPINVAKRGIEYSPISIGTAIGKFAKGDAEGAINDLAKGITGTGMLVVGILLASLGWLRTKNEDKDEVLDTQENEQMYSMRIPQDDGTVLSVSLDALMPAAMPLLVGVETAKLLEEEGLTVRSFLESLTGIVDPIVENSMLDGLNDMLSYVGYSDSALGSILKDMGESYVEQFRPSILRQTAQAFDPTVRTTYAPKDSPIFKSAETHLRSLGNALPFGAALSEKADEATGSDRFGLQPKIDVWGNEVKRADTLAGRALQSYVLPFNVRTVTKDPINDELRRLYKEDSTYAVLPKAAEKSYEYKNETYYADPAEYTALAKGKGQQSYEYLQNVMDTKEYKALPDAKKADVIANLYKYANYKAKQEFFDGRGIDYVSDTFNSVEKAVARGITAEDYYLMKAAMDGGENAEAKKDYYTEQLTNKQQAFVSKLPADEVSASWLARVALYNQGLNGKTASAYDDILIGEKKEKVDYTDAASVYLSLIDSGSSSKIGDKYYEIAQPAGISVEDYMIAYFAQKDVTYPEKTKGAKAAAEKAAIDKALPNLSQKQRNALYEAFK